MATEETRQRRKLAAILMADVSGFSRMMGFDEERTTALIQDFHRRVEAIVSSHEGRVVDTAGDSVFAEFDSVVNATRCAGAIQADQARANAGRPDAERIETRIGVHLGDVIIEDYRVYGDGVNIAARLESIADPGAINISEAVYQQVYNKIDLEMHDLGMTQLKNIEHPVRVYTIPPSALVPRRPASGPTKRRAAELLEEGAASRRRGRTARSARTRARPPAPRPSGPIAEDLIRPATFVPLVVAGGLLLSPLFLFPTGGVLPTGGAVLAGTLLGRVWSVRSGEQGWTEIGIGIGIAAGAILTDWSLVTNGFFALAGAVFAAIGFGRRARADDTD